MFGGGVARGLAKGGGGPCDAALGLSQGPTGELLRRELDGAEASWRTLDWSSVPPAELSAQWAKAQAEDATQSIDLATAPLVRFLAITLPGGHCHLLATFPKLLLDEDSLFHLICEWLEALEGRPLPATPLEEGEPTSSATPAVADWWGQFFNNAPEPVRVQVLPAPAEQNPHRAASRPVPHGPRDVEKNQHAGPEALDFVRRHLPRGLEPRRRAPELAQSRGHAGSPARCAEPGPAECGLHDNLLPFQAAINGGQSAEAFLKEIARGEKDRANHSSIPLERVLLLSQPQRRLRDFSTAFRWLPPSINDRVHDVFPRWINLDAQLHQQSFFPLTFEVRDGSRFALDLQYSDALPRGEAEQLLARIRGVLDFFETPNKRLSEIRLLDNEQWQLFKDSETPRKAEPALSIEKQIAEAVILHAETLAVEGPSDGALTYGELDSHATSSPPRLRHENLAEGWTVGVCLTPTPWLPVAVLGILRAGDTCLPLDPGADRAWLLQKAEGCDAELILCDSYTAQFFEGKRVLVLDQQWDTVSAIPATAAAGEIKPPKASFFVTTAEPTDSSSVIALILRKPPLRPRRQFAELLSLEEGHRVPLVAAAGTGAFVETLLGTLASGATLVLCRPAMTSPATCRICASPPPNGAPGSQNCPSSHGKTWPPPTCWNLPKASKPPRLRTAQSFENLHTICVEAALLPPTLHAEWQRLNEGQTRWIQYASPAGLCGQSVRFVQMENARSLPDPAEVPLGAPGPGVRAELHDFAGHPCPPATRVCCKSRSTVAARASPPGAMPGGLFHLAPTAESLLEKALSEAPGVLLTCTPAGWM